MPTRTIKHSWVVNGTWRDITQTNDFVDHFMAVGGLSDLRTAHYPLNMIVQDYIAIANKDGSILVPNGYTLTFDITKVANYLSVSKDGEGPVATLDIDTSKIASIQVNAKTVNGSVIQLPIESYYVGGNNGVVNISFHCPEVPTDIKEINIYYVYDMNAYKGYSSYAGKTNYSFTRYGGFLDTYMDVEYYKNDPSVEESANFLENIINWLSSLYDTIFNMPSKIANSIRYLFDALGDIFYDVGDFLGGLLESVSNGITDMSNAIKNKLQEVQNGITSALTSLGNFIIDGIKDLFIPSQEDIVEVKDSWSSLLEDRFGALYQSMTIVYDFIERLTEQEIKTITLPKVTIPLGNTEYSFGGYTVDIVPTGFDFLVSACKLITSIVCTFFVLNGLKNRLDRLIGGSDNI